MSITSQGSTNKEIALFLSGAFGLSWLFIAPLWFDARGLEAPYAIVLMVGMMFTPLLAVALVHVVMRPGDIKNAFALKFRRELWRPLLLSWVSPAPLVLTSLAVAAVFGWYVFDLDNFSALAGIIEDAAPGVELPFSYGVLALLLVVQAITLAPINMLATIGEELGWRGFLHDRLRRTLSLPMTAVVTGVIWGLWHTPILLLGYNYPQHAAYGPALFVVFCVLVSFPLGVLRERTSSSLPAILAHASINAAAGLVAIFHHVDHPPDAALAGIIGVSGWIVLLPVVMASLMWGKLWGKRRAKPMEKSQASSAADVS